ncbi:solute carrier family 25, member 30-like [Thraustotheca clavata]|uniref:Solute carrier family 25, member 30-like n=1 Tax=Thraustotheca clavata TaxID=74557 RepID=A0A1V9Y7G4_9STRA|nr:solute carrier family 25, member 30-like [Thraustotheca clavata]
MQAQADVVALPVLAPTIGTKILLAGIANASAAAITNPIDVLKVRMQLEGELASTRDMPRRYPSFLGGARTIYSGEGIKGFYKGLVPSVARDGFYSGIRLGAYEPMKELLGATDPHHTPLYLKILAGAITGAFGSALANPTDLIKIRMQGEGNRYPNVRAAFQDIVEHDGVKGLWKGVGPTMKRAALLTASQIPTYDHAKHTLLNHEIMEEGFPLHAVCSMLAGFMAATVTSPGTYYYQLFISYITLVDVIKTRMMTQCRRVNGVETMYTGTFDAFRKIVAGEGIRGLYKGWLPNWMRLGPHTMITLVIFEELRQAAGLPPL